MSNMAGTFTVVVLMTASVAWSDDFTIAEKPWLGSKDPVARMWQRWQQGEFKPALSDARACVASVLAELQLSPASQTLVFSKTSLQNSAIDPQNPRSVFFNEECYAGWAQEGVLEIIGMDPEAGPRFYSLTLPGTGGGKPELRTTEICLSCHQGPRTGGVPGMLVRSVYTGESGQPMLNEGSLVTGHESPLRDRWGGWYVTGDHGTERHRGNSFAQRRGMRISFDPEAGANVTTLGRYLPTERYLAPGSDIVALMVLEHQCVMHNKLTDAARSTRDALARQREAQQRAKEPVTDAPQGAALAVINEQAEAVVRHLLFCGDYALKDGIAGDPAYQEAFRRNRVATKDGRSLKDFELRTRLFQHRCSHMIYSCGFEALPPAVKQVIYRRLHDVLTGKDQGAAFAHLSAAERRNIREILQETKKDLPGNWGRE